MARTSRRRAAKKVSDNQSEEESDAVKETETIVLKPKGKRGRPPKAATNASESESTSVPKISEDKSVDDKQTKAKPKTKRGRKPKSAVVDTDSGSTSESKTKPVETIGKRGRRSTKVNTDSKVFSQKEKKAFYECLKENGMSCLNDETLLQQTLPNRSMTEIKAMIDGFTRKAQELNRKAEESLSGIETESNDNKQPIEKWFDLIHQLIPNPSKKDDISAVFADILDDLKKECQTDGLQSMEGSEEGLTPDYRSVYECISAALNGKYIKQIKPINALIIVNLIEELKQLIKSDFNNKELLFLNSGVWWETPNQTNAQKSGGPSMEAIKTQRRQQSSSEEQTQSQTEDQTNDNTEEEEETPIIMDDTNEETNYETLSSYPKLRKIIECLNPLRVPIDLLTDEYQRF